MEFSLIQVNVKTTDNGTVPILIQPTDSVERLNELIQVYVGIPIEMQQLFFNDVKLNSGCLMDFHVESGSIIVLRERLPSDSDLSQKKMDARWLQWIKKRVTQPTETILRRAWYNLF